MKTKLKCVILALFFLSPVFLSSCDVMLETLAAGMNGYNPYGYSSLNPYYGGGSNDYLLDPMYAAQQASREIAQMNAMNQQFINQTIQQVKQEEDEEYMRMTGGKISREEWNAITAQALAEQANESSSSQPAYQGKLSPSQYEDTYRRYEKSVQDFFGILTHDGYKTVDSQGNISGKTVGQMPSGAYIKSQTELRDAQKEMKRIRLEAAQYGVHIPESKWETASAGY